MTQLINLYGPSAKELSDFSAFRKLITFSAVVARYEALLTTLPTPGEKRLFFAAAAAALDAALCESDHVHVRICRMFRGTAAALKQHPALRAALSGISEETLRSVHQELYALIGSLEEQASKAGTPEALWQSESSLEWIYSMILDDDYLYLRLNPNRAKQLRICA